MVSKDCNDIFDLLAASGGSGGGGSSTPASYLTITNVYSVNGGFRVTYTVNGVEAEIELPMEGTDDIIVDIDAANQKINIHLDADVRTKLGKMLLLPTEAPATTELIGVGTNKAQMNLNPGEVRKLLDVKKMVKLTLEEYAEIQTKDANTLYLIVN